MNEPLNLVQHVPTALKALAETDLSLVEQAAVLRLAAEACLQAQILQEITLSISRGRKA